MFSDLPDSHYAAGPIGYAAALGYVSGDAGAFGVGNTINSVGLYSTILSMLGIAKEDINGVDWEIKVGDMINRLGLSSMMVVGNKETITRADAARVLYASLDLPMFVKSAGSYVRDGGKTLLSKFSDPLDEGSFTIQGKVVATKYGQLANTAGTYGERVLIELTKAADGNAVGYVVQMLASDCDDDAVPVRYLGREVTLSVVKKATNLYRPAKGASVDPVYTNDIVHIGSGAYFNEGIKEIIGYGTNIGSKAPRGAYMNYAAGSHTTAANWGYVNDLSLPNTNTAKQNKTYSYAYAIRWANTPQFSEIFYLDYRALVVAEIYNNRTITFNNLNGTAATDLVAMETVDFENGTKLKKGDVIVAVVRAQGNLQRIVTADVIEAKTGVLRSHTANFFLVDNIEATWNESRYMDGSFADRADVNNYANNVNYGDYRGTVTYYAFQPVYALRTGSNEKGLSLFHFVRDARYNRGLASMFTWTTEADWGTPGIIQQLANGADPADGKLSYKWDAPSSWTADSAAVKSRYALVTPAQLKTFRDAVAAGAFYTDLANAPYSLTIDGTTLDTAGLYNKFDNNGKHVIGVRYFESSKEIIDIAWSHKIDVAPKVALAGTAGLTFSGEEAEKVRLTGVGSDISGADVTWTGIANMGVDVNGQAITAGTMANFLAPDSVSATGIAASVRDTDKLVLPSAPNGLTAVTIVKGDFKGYPVTITFNANIEGAGGGGGGDIMPITSIGLTNFDTGENFGEGDAAALAPAWGSTLEATREAYGATVTTGTIVVAVNIPTGMSMQVTAATFTQTLPAEGTTLFGAEPTFSSAVIAGSGSAQNISFGGAYGASDSTAKEGTLEFTLTIWASAAPFSKIGTFTIIVNVSQADS